MDGREITGDSPKPYRMDGAPMVEFRSSTRALVFQSGTGWLGLLAAAVVIGAASWFGYWWQALLGVTVVALPVLLYVALSNRTHLYWIDAGRLFMRRGIVMRSEEEVELYRIKDVRVNFSVIQQLFDNGDITITSTDVTGQPGSLTEGTGGARSVVHILNVVDARDIREELRNRVEQVRERRGVREFDIG